VLARFAIVASACLALTLGGCSLTPSSSANTSGFTGTKATIATKINQLASDVSSSDGLDICENVLATSVRAKLNKVGSCQTIIKNQIKTIDDNTITIEKISLAGTTATATVQSTVNGKKVDSSMTLAKQSGGWRIATISAL
jgi:hypothetical protein